MAKVTEDVAALKAELEAAKQREEALREAIESQSDTPPSVSAHKTYVRDGQAWAIIVPGFQVGQNFYTAEEAIENDAVMQHLIEIGSELISKVQ